MMSSPETTYARPLAAILIIAAIIILAAGASVRSLVDATILRDSELKAVKWARDFSTQVPDLEQLARTGRATPQQIEMVAATIAGGDILRFELFSPEGRLRFDSSDPNAVFDGSIVNDTARAVFARGANDVAVEDGRDDPEMPDTYVEAYVPAIGADGGTFAVVEVYVDADSLAAALNATLNRHTLQIVLGSLAVFLIPSIFLVQRTRQVRERDKTLISFAKRDALTGVMNRGAFSEGLTELFMTRGEKGQAIGLLFVDLDRFKVVNDTLGHDFGDRLLRHVAGILSDTVRDGDLVGRIGGDEFVIAMPGVTRDGLLRVGARIIERMKTPFEWAGNTVEPGASLGAHLSPPGEEESEALHAADVAVYQAKENGRGMVEEYSAELQRLLARRQHVEKLVRSGLSQDRFFLNFQPIFDASGSCVKGYEALLRLRDTDDTVIPPGEFIAVAERTGRMHQIGNWVLRRAIAEASNWDAGTYITVNLSPMQFGSGDLVSTVANILAEYSFAPDRLTLEVTEALLSDRDPQIEEQLADLQMLGVALSLDDFGTGYSSLGYLWHYRFDRLKIDSLAVEALNDRVQKASDVIATLVSLGRSMGMTVTVEGIETRAQHEQLEHLGCDELQGYLFGRPGPAPEASAENRQTGT